MKNSPRISDSEFDLELLEPSSEKNVTPDQQASPTLSTIGKTTTLAARFDRQQSNAR